MIMLDTLKALADPTRLRLVAILLRIECTVQELTSILQVGQSKVSWHLKILADAGILSVKRQGTWSYYRVSEGNGFFDAIRDAVVHGLDQLPERNGDLAAVARVLEERRQRSQTFFDRHAREWDTLVRALLPVPVYRRRLLEMVPDGVTVLEIGVGTGSLLKDLSARSNGVIGVDHSPAMLEEARSRLAVDGITGVELRLGEMTHLPLADAAVQCVVANMVMHHAADPQAVLAEIRRVLVPGGLLLIADLARHEREEARERLADQWLGFDEDELTDWLKGTGFPSIDCQLLPGANGENAVLLVRSCTS